jgi:hypothetical protein
MVAQVAVAGCALLLAYRVMAILRAWFSRLQVESTSLQELITFSKILGPLLAFIFLWIPYGVAEHFNWPRHGLYTISICMVALAAVRFFTGQMQSRSWG